MSNKTKVTSDTCHIHNKSSHKRKRKKQKQEEKKKVTLIHHQPTDKFFSILLFVKGIQMYRNKIIFYYFYQ